MDRCGHFAADASQVRQAPGCQVPGAGVRAAIDRPPRLSSMVENLNSRLRWCFFLRRHLGDAHLSLLQFFLNHRVFMRSRRAERGWQGAQGTVDGSSPSTLARTVGLRATYAGLTSARSCTADPSQIARQNRQTAENSGPLAFACVTPSLRLADVGLVLSIGCGAARRTNLG